MSEAKKPTRYELIDKHGQITARHSNAQWLVDRAKEFWPDQNEDPEGAGAGWNIRLEGAGR